MMNDTPETAGARKLWTDSGEIAAIALEHAAERASREGRVLDPKTDFVWMIGPLLTAAWMVARSAFPGDEAEARRRYVDLLKLHADGVEGAGEG